MKVNGSKQRLDQIMESEITKSRTDRCVEVQFKFENLEEKYVGNVLNLTHMICESDATLSQFKPKLRIWHTDDYERFVAMADLDYHFKPIVLSIENTRFLRCKFDCFSAMFGDDEPHEILPETQTTKKLNNEVMEVGMFYAFSPSNFNEKLKSIEGTLKITFEPNESICLNQVLELEFSILRLPKELEDFGIRCENTEVKFNKDFLCKISDVFAAMIENPHTSESRQGFVIIENVRANFIRQFKEIVCNGNVTKEDLNVELLMFADRYNIQPLVKLSKNQVEKTVTKENLIDVIKIADALNDDQLLKAAVDFVSENKGSFENDPELVEMMKTNPQCFSKMWGLFMFQNRN